MVDRNAAGYDIGQHVGRGGFANVFRAVDRATGETVAVKMVSLELLRSNDLESRFRREVDLHRSLDSPHIARLVDYFETPEHGCVVVEFCAGGDLRSMLKRRGRLSEDEARIVGRQLLRGVSYLHSKGIMHRDLKLANILLVSQDQLDVKICDLGVAARTRSRKSDRWTLCGTPHYMAPEIVEGKEPHGLPADIFSIGCILFSLLTGEATCQDRRRASAALASSGVSDDAKDLIAKMMAHNPKDRPGARAAQRHPFFHVASSAQCWSARPVADWERTAAAAAVGFDEKATTPKRFETLGLRPFCCRTASQVVSVDAQGSASLECRVKKDLWAKLVVQNRAGRVELSLVRRGAQDQQNVLFHRPATPLASLERKYWPLYNHLARAVELAKSRTPRIVVRMTGNAAGDFSCVLMENGPLADVRATWRNATARYSLKTLCLELDVGGEHFVWRGPKKEDGGGQLSAENTPHLVFAHVADLQAGIKLCLSHATRNKNVRSSSGPLVVDKRAAVSPCSSSTTQIKITSPLSQVSDLASTADLDDSFDRSQQQQQQHQSHQHQKRRRRRRRRKHA